MRKDLAVIYDEFAETYDSQRGKFDMTSVFDAFCRGFKSGPGDLLDLGCGAGEPFAAAFAKHGWKVTGVDFSVRMLDLARRYVPDMRTVLSDMREVDFGPEQFDAVTLIYSLFHIPTADQLAVLDRVYRWLRPGGRVLFTYAVKEYSGEDEFDGYIEFMGQELFYSHTTPEKLFSHIKGMGFDVQAKDYREIGGEAFLWVTMEKPLINEL